jgi:hypothetical protein
MEQGMCQFRSSTKEIEYYSENKVLKKLLNFVCLHFFEFFAIDSSIFFFCFCRFASKVIIFQETL